MTSTSPTAGTRAHATRPASRPRGGRDQRRRRVAALRRGTQQRFPLGGQGRRARPVRLELDDRVELVSMVTRPPVPGFDGAATTVSATAFADSADQARELLRVSHAETSLVELGAEVERETPKDQGALDRAAHPARRRHDAEPGVPGGLVLAGPAAAVRGLVGPGALVLRGLR